MLPFLYLALLGHTCEEMEVLAKLEGTCAFINWNNRIDSQIFFLDISSTNKCTCNLGEKKKKERENNFIHKLDYKNCFFKSNEQQYRLLKLEVTCSLNSWSFKAYQTHFASKNLFTSTEFNPDLFWVSKDRR